MNSGKVNTAQGCGRKLGPQGQALAGEKGKVGNHEESRSHGEDSDCTGPTSECRAGKEHFFGVSALLPINDVGGMSPFSLSLSFLKRQEKIRYLSKVCEDEGRPCIQKPGRVPYAQYSVSDNYLPSGLKAQNWSQQTDEVASIPS